MGSEANIQAMTSVSDGGTRGRERVGYLFITLYCSLSHVKISTIALIAILEESIYSTRTTKCIHIPNPDDDDGRGGDGRWTRAYSRRRWTQYKRLQYRIVVNGFARRDAH